MIAEAMNIDKRNEWKNFAQGPQPKTSLYLGFSHQSKKNDARKFVPTFL